MLHASEAPTEKKGVTALINSHYDNSKLSSDIVGSETGIYEKWVDFELNLGIQKGCSMLCALFEE